MFLLYLYMWMWFKQVDSSSGVEASNHLQITAVVVRTFILWAVLAQTMLLLLNNI